MGLYEQVSIYSARFCLLILFKMKRLSFIFISLLFFQIAEAGEEKQTAVETLRYYYNGAWRNTPPFDEEKHFFWDNERRERFPEAHIHRPGSGYIFHEGKWVVDRNTRRGKHQTGEYFYDGKWHSRPKKEIYNFNTVWLKNDFRDFVSRKDFVCDVIEREYELGRDSAKRLIGLINRGDVEKILEIPRERDGLPLFVFNREEMLLYVKAQADKTAKLMTLIMNGIVYNACAGADEKGMKCEILSLVDPVFYENDAGKSDIIMAMNVSGILRLLKPDSEDYRRRGGAHYINQEYCTFTIIDKKEVVGKISEYLDSIPYAPARSQKRLIPSK